MTKEELRNKRNRLIDTLTDTISKDLLEQKKRSDNIEMGCEVAYLDSQDLMCIRVGVEKNTSYKIGMYHYGIELKYHWELC